MISLGAFWTSVEKSRILLNNLNFLQDISNKRGSYSSSFFQNKDTDDYIKLFDSNLINSDFELLLKDNSHFQFKHDVNGLSMSYFPRPNEFLDYEEYIYELFKDEISDLPIQEAKSFLQDVLNGDNQGEYEQYLLELENVKNIVPLRVDYDPNNYNKLFHPMCHLHVGLKNDIRIAMDKVATPYLFSLLVLKNYFPKLFFVKASNGDRIVNPNISFENKTLSPVIQSPYFDDEDRLIHLS